MSLPSAISHSIQQYDYIILGAGCAGLSLAARMAMNPAFSEKQILLIDKGPKTVNDRTWCFWEAGQGFFENIVHHRWQDLWIRHHAASLQLQLKNYQYKLIRGIDFYQHCITILRQSANIHWHYGTVTGVDAVDGIVTTGNSQFRGGTLYSSVLLESPTLNNRQFYLLQHFRGWWIETDKDSFEPAVADLMNFRTSQQHGCAFMYVLPVSRRRALVEYTLFNEEELSDHQYDAALREFISQEMRLDTYQISEVENGVIPMTNLRFPTQQGRVTFIGTAGGQTKASSGYTFQFIQKQSDAIVNSLLLNKPYKPSTAGRFSFYDSVLLRVLHERKMGGAAVFLQLFQQNPAHRVFRFLDNESNWWDEWCIMNSTTKSIFVPAALAELRW